MSSTKDEDEDKKEFEEAPELHKVYKKRWAVLTTVSLVNIGINILMYSYSTVASDAASYFGKETSDINNFTNIGLIFSFLFSLGATWIVEKLRLR